MTENKSLPPLPSGAADDSDVALLYVYILRHGGPDATAAAGALCRLADKIEAASGQTRPASPDPERLLPPADELPSYESADLTRLAAEDAGLRAVYAEAAQVFGRKLSSAEMNMLSGIYAHLGLPAEVIFLLLHDCAERAARRKPGSVPSPRSVEKEAYEWARLEILTLEQAEEHLRLRREREESAAQIKEVLNIRDRALTKSERDYVERWIALGFSADAVAIAYDRTMLQVGKLHWLYMDRIFQSWHAKNLHSPAEIEAGDPGRRGGNAQGAQGGGSVNIHELNDILNRI